MRSKDEPPGLWWITGTILEAGSVALRCAIWPRLLAQLVVTDGCGPWPTFIGLGNGAP